MTLTWEHFAGRTDKFAIKLSLMEDPDGGEGADPEDAASWGSFQLWTGNRNLCTHTDQGESLSSTHWYLLPLAEWIAENWDPLLHEERLPLVNSADTGVVALALQRDAPSFGDEALLAARDQELFDWRDRHALRAARNGGPFPNIVLRRLRNYIEISWDSSHEAGAPHGFEFSAGRGSMLLDPRDVAEPLHAAILSLANALGTAGDRNGRISALRSRLHDLADTESVDKRTRWLAGSPPPDRGISVWDLVHSTLGARPESAAATAALAVDARPLVIERASPAALLFASVSPDVKAQDVRTLSTVLLEQYRSGERPRLDDIAEDVPLDERRRAWQQGYELAEALHEDQSLDTTMGWFDVETFLGTLDVRIVARPLTDRGIAACSIVGPHLGPVVILNELHSNGTNDATKRFTLAHELCHLLHDRARGADLAIASSPWAPRALEQRARAFAAMLLLPPHLIETLTSDLSSPVSTVRGIAELADAARVSRTATIWHLSNVGILPEVDRERLLQESGERD